MTNFRTAYKRIKKQGTRRERGRSYNLEYLYGISSNQYDDLFQKQGGVCAICGKPPTTRPLDVDHNHITEQIRGLLCSGCNGRLWAFEPENAAWKLRAELYLTNTMGADNAL